MTRAHLRLVAALTVSVAIGPLSACSAAPDPDAWQITAMRHDNRLEGEPAAQFTDVTYPMTLTDDTAGGVWGFSAGSWLHLDASGATLRRFNTLDGEAPAEIRGVAALTPELLAVSAPAVGASGAVQLFDTAAGAWEVLHRSDVILGDIATRDGQVYVVAFGPGESTFTVRRLDPANPEAAVDVTPVLPQPPVLGSTLHGAVAIDVGPGGAIFIATQAEQLVVDPDGTVRRRSAHVAATPNVAVGPDGTAAWATTAARRVDPTVVTAGTEEARRVLAQTGSCGVVIDRGVSPAVVALPCGQGLAWTDATTLVASVGGESGAVLARLAPPA